MKQEKSQKYFSGSLFLILVSLGLLRTMGMGEGSYDDAYITYRVAHNLSSGLGFTYNAGDPTFSTTTPLLTLALAFMGMLNDPDMIPVFGQWLTGMALTLLACAFLWMADERSKLFAGFIPALYMITNPALSYVWGGETLWLILFLVLAFYFFTKNSPVPSAVCAGLSFLTRGEGVLAAGLIFLGFLIQNRRIPWRYGLTFLLTILPWCLFALMKFGSFLPGTLEAKQAQLESGYWGPFFRTSIDWMRAFITGSPTFNHIESHYTHILVIILAAFALLNLKNLWRSYAVGYIIWTCLYAVGYTVLGIPFYTWYAIPLMIAVYAAAGQGGEYLSLKLGDYPRVRAFVFAFLLLPVISGWIVIREYQKNPVSQVQQMYTKTGRWLAEHTRPDSSIGFFEIGFMGYYSKNIFVDPMGLATPAAIAYVEKGDFIRIYQEKMPDYIILTPVRWQDRIGRMTNKPWFKNAYIPVHEISEPGYGDSPLRIYSKIKNDI